jgi:hypothetical protein
MSRCDKCDCNLVPFLQGPALPLARQQGNPAVLSTGLCAEKWRHKRPGRRRKMGRILWFLARYCGFANRRDIQRAPSQVRAQVRQKAPPGRWVHQIVLARAAQRENH